MHSYAYFQGDTFGHLLAYVQTHPHSASLKERKQQLVFAIESVPSVAAAKRLLSELGSAEPVG